VRISNFNSERLKKEARFGIFGETTCMFNNSYQKITLTTTYFPQEKKEVKLRALQEIYQEQDRFLSVNFEAFF
jgi:hypothetical protein